MRLAGIEPARGSVRCPAVFSRFQSPVLVLQQSNGRRAMALGDEIDEIFRREVKSLPAYEKAQAAGGSVVAPPVEEMNHLLMGLVIAVQRSFHLLANRVEDIKDV